MPGLIDRALAGNAMSADRENARETIDRILNHACKRTLGEALHGKGKGR